MPPAAGQDVAALGKGKQEESAQAGAEKEWLAPHPLLFSGVVHISPSFQFSTADLPFCNWAQRPLQAQVENAQLYLAALESTLQPQGRRRRRNQRDQPYLHQVYFPTKAEKSCQGCQLLRSVRTAQKQFNHGFGVSNGPCDAARKYALLNNCQC